MAQVQADGERLATAAIATCQVEQIQNYLLEVCDVERLPERDGQYHVLW
jgi:hypothetical protein